MPENDQHIIQDIDVSRMTISEVNDFIGKSPSWLLRSGITVIALVIGVILIMASFIKYPDKILAQGVLTASQTPKEIKSRAEGYIADIYISNDGMAKNGEAILYIQNTASKSDVATLEHWLTADRRNRPRFPQKLQLGSLQNTYANLSLRYNEYQQLRRNQLVAKKVKTIGDEIDKISLLNKAKTKENTLFDQEFDLHQKTFDRDMKLTKAGVKSASELEQSRIALLQKERSAAQMKNGLIQNQIRIEQLQMEQLRLTGERQDKLLQSKQALDDLELQMHSAIADWKERYIIAAPEKGRLYLVNSLKRNMYITAGQSIGYMLPIAPENNSIMAQAPMSQAGKLAVGQRAIIRFDAYPYKEYGQVIATLDKIAPLPLRGSDGQSFYELTIALPDAIVTDYNRVISYRPDMTAQVQIITEDQTILQRIFHQFMNLLKHRT